MGNSRFWDLEILLIILANFYIDQKNKLIAFLIDINKILHIEYINCRSKHHSKLLVNYYTKIYIRNQYINFISIIKLEPASFWSAKLFPLGGFHHSWFEILQIDFFSYKFHISLRFRANHLIIWIYPASVCCIKFLLYIFKIILWAISWKSIVFQATLL